DGTLFQVNYIFNAVPRDIEVAIRAWRLLTTDARVHQARPIRLKLHMAVILELGYPLAAVEDALEEELSRYISGVGFNGVVQVSDLMEVAARVSGVDAVRFLNSDDDGTNYAIQRVNAAGSVEETYQVGGRAADVLIGDDEYPVFNELVLVQKAQNSWGT